jgi:hypothetical protein
VGLGLYHEDDGTHGLDQAPTRGPG